VRRFLLSTLLLAIVAIWGWTFVVVKHAVDEFHVLPFLALRFTIGALCVGAFCLHRMNLSTGTVGGLIGVVLAAAYLFQTLGLAHSTPTNTGLITGLFIIFTPLANRLLFGVRTRVVLWLAIGVSLCGLALLTAGAGMSGIRTGDPLTLGCAVCFGLHVALLDRYSKQHRATVLVFAQLAAASLLFWIACSATDLPKWPSAQVWGALLITGVGATAVAFFVQTFVQQRLSAIETAMIILLEPIFAAVFGYWLHGDRLNALQIAGAVLMVAAVFAVEIHGMKRLRESARL
jgi:drug/metabolite transporter (DMT)-like permease